MAAWLQSEDGMDTSPESAESKLNTILMKRDCNVGITVSADAGWQPRVVGKSTRSSRTGHNFDLGVLCQKIVSVQACSQNCRVHGWCEKRNRPVPLHRCPRDFPRHLSSKAMEPLGAVQHCVDTSKQPAGVHISTVLWSQMMTQEREQTPSIPAAMSSKRSIQGHRTMTERFPVIERGN